MNIRRWLASRLRTTGSAWLRWSQVAEPRPPSQDAQQIGLDEVEHVGRGGHRHAGRLVVHGVPLPRAGHSLRGAATEDGES